MDTKGVYGVVQLTSTLSTFSRQCGASFLRVHDAIRQTGDGGSRIAKEIGITGVSTAQLNWGVPGRRISGLQRHRKQRSDTRQRAAQLPDHRQPHVDSRRTHPVKMGYDIRQTRFLLDSDNGPRGSFTFNASYTAELNPATGNPDCRVPAAASIPARVPDEHERRHGHIGHALQFLHA